MSFTGAEIRRSLTKKGFEEDPKKHIWLVLVVDNHETTIKTCVSHGSKDYGDNMLSKMAGQLKISYREYKDLIRCPIDYEMLVAILKEKGKIE